MPASSSHPSFPWRARRQDVAKVRERRGGWREVIPESTFLRSKVRHGENIPARHAKAVLEH